MHIYLAISKRSYIENGKYLEANAQAMIALKKILNNDYLFRIVNCDFDLAMCNTLIFLEQQLPNDMERESNEDDFDQECFIVQGSDSLEVSL